MMSNQVSLYKNLYFDGLTSKYSVISHLPLRAGPFSTLLITVGTKKDLRLLGLFVTWSLRNKLSVPFNVSSSQETKLLSTSLSQVPQTLSLFTELGRASMYGPVESRYSSRLTSSTGYKNLSMQVRVPHIHKYYTHLLMANNLVGLSSLRKEVPIDITFKFKLDRLYLKELVPVFFLSYFKINLPSASQQLSNN